MRPSAAVPLRRPKTDAEMLGTLAPVAEAAYQADLVLLDRYQGYSTELARLSLLGIGALAFFFGQLSDNRDSPVLNDPVAGLALGGAALLFTFAVACALSHRYHSSDGLASHIEAIRLSSQAEPDVAGAVAQARERTETYKVSGRWLGAAVSLFGAGGLLFSFALARMIYVWTQR